jgi:hypothetical protein
MSAPKENSVGIESLRLPVNYGATHGVQKLTVSVPVGKPAKTQFFQVHPDESMVFQAAIYEDKADSTTYVLTPAVAAAFPDLARPVELYRAIDRAGNQRLIPVPLPGENGQRNPWHESLLQAVIQAKSKWVRVSANRSAGSYDVHVAQGDLQGPNWPSTALEELVDVAFRGRIISANDHAVIQSIQGHI